MVPGLYRWGTGVTIADDLTITGGANDVWIFQITNDLELSAATTVSLSGGAEARNVPKSAFLSFSRRQSGALRDAGYFGPFGIDALRHDDRFHS